MDELQKGLSYSLTGDQSTGILAAVQAQVDAWAWPCRPSSRWCWILAW